MLNFANTGEIVLIEGWKRVWDSKFNCLEGIDEKTLLSLTGYDSVDNAFELVVYENYLQKLANLLGISSKQSVYEFGCGAGFFLSSISKMTGCSSVGGSDYAQGLVKVAKQAFPSGAFEHCEAAKVPVLPRYDHVFANSVFHYFDFNYAQMVVEMMCRKSILSFSILDVPDRRLINETEDYRKNNANLHSQTSVKLEHTYYDRDWFLNLPDALKKPDISVKIIDGFDYHVQRQFRFDVIFTKKPGGKSD